MNTYIERKQQEYWEKMVKTAETLLESAEYEKKYWKLKHSQEDSKIARVNDDPDPGSSNGAT